MTTAAAAAHERSCVKPVVGVIPKIAEFLLSSSMKEILSLAELLPEPSIQEGDPFGRCICIEELQPSLSTAQLNLIMAQAFGPVSESTVFTNAGCPTSTAICIFVHKHSAMAAAGVPVLARRGEPLARRFLTIFGPQARIKCYEPAGLEEGLLVPGLCPLGLPISRLPGRVICLEEELLGRPSTPSTGRTQSTAWSDVVPPRRAEEEEVKVLARRALRLVSGEDLDGGPAASCQSVSDRELRRCFSVGRPVAAVFSGDSSSEEGSDVSEDEGCAQQ